MGVKSTLGASSVEVATSNKKKSKRRPSTQQRGDRTKGGPQRRRGAAVAILPGDIQPRGSEDPRPVILSSWQDLYRVRGRRLGRRGYGDLY